jgi:hypothetical protein
MATFNALLLYGYRPISAAIVRYWSAITVVAALFDCLAIAALTLAASATEHSICRKNKRPPVASGSPPQNCASSSMVGPTFLPKWTRRRTYQRICNEIQALEAKAKQTRFRKQIDIRTFGYHVA